MGEAKRRAEAYGAGRSFRPPRVCPNCKSIQISRMELPPGGMSHRETLYDFCRACETIWEAYPDDWCEEVVCAAPCDNCAFRAGSPEQADPEQWKGLMSQLRAGHEFRCHKGAPIEGLFGKRNLDGGGTVEFDAEWIKHRGRKCAGFMRLVWAMRGKGDNWLERRTGLCAAPDYDLPFSK